MVKTEYRIKGSADITIAVVSDLHEFPPDEVLSILKAVQPDVIAVPGDLLERHEFGENLDKEDESLVSRLLCSCIHLANKIAGLRWRQKHDVKKENAYRFLMEAGKLAPVLYSLGNHELYLTDEDRAVMDAAGVHLLNNSSVVIGGSLFGGIPSKQTSGKIDEEFLNSFSEAGGYKVLLCHHPEYYEKIKQYNIDLMLSGHAHGGQIRICGQGCFSPGQGLLPRYTKGVVEGRLVVSAGCSNTASIPRFGNPCEVVVVKIEHSPIR